VHVWDWNANKTLHQLKGPQAEIRCLAFSPDGKKLAASGERVIHLWDPRAGHALGDSGPRPLAQTSLSISPDGSRLAHNGGGAASKVWDIVKRQPLLNLEEK